MDSQKLKVILVVIIAAFAALYLGVAAATAQMEAIAWVAGALFLVFVLALGKHIWVLIPLSLALTGFINAIPGAPAAWWVSMAVAGGIYAMRFLMRRTENLQFRFNWLDFAILLQVVAVGQAFLRNPTGLSLFGGDVVGGKPYIIFGCAFAAYAVLSITRTDIKVFKWVVIGMILVSIGDGFLVISSQLFPVVAMMVIPIYSGVDFSASRGDVFEVDEGRLTTGKQIGQTLGLAACSLHPPMHSLIPFRIVPFLMMMSACAAIALSGFRSSFGWLMIVFVVGCLVRRRYADLVISGTAGFLALIMLLGTGLSRDLPFGIQRVLSVVPFMDVDDTIRHNAEKSTTWRVEMWKLALFTDRYISNKLLGDGFNYSAAELQAAQDSTFGDQRRAAGMNMQDIMLARGSYHGFHVETIRFTGALGLVFALIAMSIWLRYALRLIRHFKGRPEWGYVIFVCLPFLIHPFYYMLVFGAYRSGFPELLVASGMLKILDNIRVRELAASRHEAQVAVQEPSQPFARRPATARFPQPAARVR